FYTLTCNFVHLSKEKNFAYSKENAKNYRLAQPDRRSLRQMHCVVFACLGGNTEKRLHEHQLNTMNKNQQILIRVHPRLSASHLQRSRRCTNNY
ncbi:MAG: hypothetical protein WAS33_26460, partial [Candidatus Promineifilaceae bacterium]